MKQLFSCSISCTQRFARFSGHSKSVYNIFIQFHLKKKKKKNQVLKSHSFLFMLQIIFLSIEKGLYIKRKHNIMARLHIIWKAESQKCFYQWKTHWNKCVNSKGIILKKFNILFLIHFCLNTDSVLVLIEQTVYILNLE